MPLCRMVTRWNRWWELLPEVTPSYLVVVPVRNAAPWIEDCLRSIQAQTRPFRCIVADDVSTDNTYKIAQAVVANDNRFVVRTAPTRRWPLHNIVVSLAGALEDVAVLVDGDDRLAHGHVLDRLDQAYAAGAWVTYGTFVRSDDGSTGFGPYDGYNFRHMPWRGSHLKTFRTKLISRVRAMDFRDVDGQFFRTAGDVALMFPLLEMARERAVHIPDVLYYYNMDNPMNEYKVDGLNQHRVSLLLRERPSYSRVGSL